MPMLKELKHPLCFILVFLTTIGLSNGQSTLDSIPLVSYKKAAYYNFLFHAVQAKKFPGQVDREFNPFLNEAFRVFLWDELVIQVPFLFEENDCFFVVYQNDLENYHVIYNDEKGLMKRIPIGDSLTHLYRKSLDEFMIFIVKTISKDQQTNEIIGDCILFSKEKDSCVFHKKTINEWIDYSDHTKETNKLFHSHIQFQMMDDEFFAVQIYSSPEPKIKNYRFVEGIFE